MNDIERYIRDNIGKTIKCKAGMKPFTVPCISETYTDFYYWDTYFTDFALLRLGDYAQVENNLGNMKGFLDTLGYVPNSDITINRSQPPLFARAVYDYYLVRGENEQIARRYLPAIVKEHAFWMKERLLPCGLNGYKHNADGEYLDSFCSDIEKRVGCEGAYADRLRQGAHFLAIAESGWDFTPRFYSANNRYAGMDYAPVDLNAILYNMEEIAARFALATGDTALADGFTAYAAARKTLMLQYMTGEHGLLFDYNAAEGHISRLYHAAMFAPFALGVPCGKEGAEELLARLELDCGIAACESRADVKFDQWDYPSMWPPLVYFCAEGLEKAGLHEHAVRIARKYCSAVEDVFEKTGTLWEKYDARTGTVAENAEYTTPPMLGWTAGVYCYLIKKYKNEE